MRSLPSIVLGLIAWLGVAGCSSIATYVEHSPSADFGSLSTYDWATPQGPKAGDTTGNDILDARVRHAVDEALADRGFQKRTDGSADFLVAYSAAVESALQSVTIDRYYGYTSSTYLAQSGTSRNRPRSTMGQQKVVYETQQGSLILDISLPEPRQLVWRGFARAVIEADETQAQRDARLREAVRKLLAQFPP